MVDWVVKPLHQPQIMRHWTLLDVNKALTKHTKQIHDTQLQQNTINSPKGHSIVLVFTDLVVVITAIPVHCCCCDHHLSYILTGMHSDRRLPDTFPIHQLLLQFFKLESSHWQSSMALFTQTTDKFSGRTSHLTIFSSSVKARWTNHLVLAVLNSYEDGQTKEFERKGLGTSTGCLRLGYLANHHPHFDYPQNNTPFVSPTPLWGENTTICSSSVNLGQF